ncbi:aminotransferase class I/II-fold pyridoxal phosphate-dependent enzyme [Pseudoclavibacter chungangensis]|uniref:Aminotransferase n=1 Tax=Pseudoclavibacter chungangensis TaxID=587635 RepID=A0A7J5BQM5_9MICO|nr:aminotransferase class I/II-fold pyridoxal phosphate-dependent enzyme [Pseudoclavibacter chungangensis]KAB1656324.1 aminotransferase class I/II-fold pyridoxal phosphate-dependent enzyme [Pseudoclavibacter chungangensis]NYJ67091.1 aspartate aminotransferase [Pseudoclavibacter chungangensis]
MSGVTNTAAFRPSARVARIRESPSTLAANRVRELRAAGTPIIDLTIGEPDFDTPRNVKDAGIAAIEAGRTKYTAVNGTPELRAAIRARMLRASGIEFDDASIAVGGGGKQVIYMAFAATLDPGDEVIVPSPYWVSYPDMVLANDGTPVIVDTAEATGFKLTPEALRAAITPRTRWVVVNAPGNPTGAVYTRAEIEGLVEVLEAFPDVWVLADEIYDEIGFTGRPFVPFVAAAGRVRDRVLTVNGVSKSYAMTGWRLGYGVGAPGLVRAINILQSQSSSCPSSVSQAAAVVALTGDQSFITESVARYRSRRDLAVDRFGEIDGLRPIVPDGGFYVFVDCSGLIGRRTAGGTVLTSDQDVTMWLLDEARVAVIQGAAYGSDAFFRTSIATSEEQIEAGARAIAEAVATLA